MESKPTRGIHNMIELTTGITKLSSRPAESPRASEKPATRPPYTEYASARDTDSCWMRNPKVTSAPMMIAPDVPANDFLPNRGVYRPHNRPQMLAVGSAHDK